MLYAGTHIISIKSIESESEKKPTEFLTRAETAKLLQINLTTLWYWTKKGKLQSYGIGNRVYYKRSEIEESIIKIIY